MRRLGRTRVTEHSGQIGRGISGGPLREVKAIQSLLKDVYSDPGTIVRELIQNADDACATRIEFLVVREGLPDATNSLLRGPALLVANNGPFSSTDADALHLAIGGSKEGDASKVGTFGLGLKSVFHICEAFAYVGAKASRRIEGILNPWIGTGGNGDDPVNPDWNVLSGVERERLVRIAEDLLNGLCDGLLLWLPLRCAGHLNRGGPRELYGLKTACVSPSDLPWLQPRRIESLALLLSQCGFLREVAATRASSHSDIHRRDHVSCVYRRADTEWLGRYDNDRPRKIRQFAGKISANDLHWQVIGAEAVGSKELKHQRARDDWPKIERWRDGRSILVPQKALAHAAVTVLRPTAEQERCLGVRLRWASYLPLVDEPNPTQDAIDARVAESFGAAPAWQIVLHGYFWPSQDRRSIAGVTSGLDQNGGASTSDVRASWNAAMRDELVLPLLPSVLEQAVAREDQEVASNLLEQVGKSRIVRSHLDAVCHRNCLLPRATEDGVSWICTDPTQRDRVLSIPRWTKAPQALRRSLVAVWRDKAFRFLVIDEHSPRFATHDAMPWAVQPLEHMLRSISTDVFKSAPSLSWLADLVSHALGGTESEASALVADWLGSAIGKGVLQGATASAAIEDRQELHGAWRRLCDALPARWLVPIPAEALTGLSVLAVERVFGRGLFPDLFREANETQSAPDPSRLDHALHAIGKQLGDESLSGNAKHTRLRLAEALFAVRRTDRPLGTLESLPLIRAMRLPAGEEIPLSIAELRRQGGLGRAFAGVDGQPASRSAVGELATALGEDVWFVRGKPVGAVPSPTRAELSKVVVRTRTFAPPAHREALLRRLVDEHEVPTVQVAIRTLLAGRSVAAGEPTILYAESDSDRRALAILSRLSRRSDVQAPAELRALVQSWDQQVHDVLSIAHVDAQAFHNLLAATRSATTWAELDEDDALHLLQHLHAPTDVGWQRWYALPLHRRNDGSRTTVVHGQTYRTVAGNGPPVPRGLEPRLTLLARPEREVEHLYSRIPELTGNVVLRLMLEDDAPERFASDILARLYPSGRHVELPDDHSLRRALRQCAWIPLRERTGAAPDDLLIAPDELLSSLRELDSAGALSGQKLPAAVDGSFWRRGGEAVVREIHGRRSRRQQLERVQDALDQQVAVRVAGGAYVIASDWTAIDPQFVTDATQTRLPQEHKGWKLIAAFANVLRGEEQEATSEAHEVNRLLVAVARKLCGPISAAHQIALLQSVAEERPPKYAAGGRVFARLLGTFADTSGFSSAVLPHIELPTQDGNWHPASEVARSTTGVARRHLVLAELRGALSLEDTATIQYGPVSPEQPRVPSVNPLREYFEPWRGRVQPVAIGSFLALLGRGLGGSIEGLAHEWLGDTITVDAQRHALTGEGRNGASAGVSVLVSSRVTDGKSVIGVNVLGHGVKMEAAAGDTLFAIDPTRMPRSNWSAAAEFRGAFWEIQLRDVQPHRKSHKDLLDLLSNTVDQWAIKCLGVDPTRVRDWSSRWRSSEADIGPARAAILANLPLILRQLGVSEHEVLRRTLAKAERTQYELRHMQTEEARKRQQQALDDLASQVEAPDNQSFLSHRVQHKMRSNGYDEASVLLELAQNADDALAQAAEIKGSNLPSNACRLVIDVQKRGCTNTIDVTHHGRPINETGGAAFPLGKERQWDQDLYFMMLMNLSGKPGESRGELGPATTGRFGLGFKSVHLLSQRPSVVSGFMSFAVVGGLLPLAEPKEDTTVVEGQLATRVRLPLRQDDALLQRAFERFDYARPLLSVFARQIREVVVRGGFAPGAHAFDGRSVDGAPGWSIGAETAIPTEKGQWRILRFKPSEADDPSTETLALAVGVRDGRPERFAREMPFLWNVVPTGEGWGCGYAVNGPFKLDPGRRHVSLDDDTTLAAATALGESLARGLVRLQDAGGPPEAGDGFFESLWHVLVAGLRTDDPVRQRFLRELHGGGRGLSGWVRSRSVVPTGLPAPFRSTLPKLTPDVPIEVARFFDFGWYRALGEMVRQHKDVLRLFHNRYVVSDAVAELLQPLLDGTNARWPELGPRRLVAELMQRWDFRLTPERLHVLRPIGREGLVWYDDRGAWQRRLVARSAAGEWTPLRQLLVSNDLDSLLDTSVEDVADELLRSSFAPDCWRIDSSYIKAGDDLKVFRWLRGDHGADSSAMTKWIVELTDGEQTAALRYLMDGSLGLDVLKSILQLPQRPAWLTDYDGIAASLRRLAKDPWERNRLLIALFPTRFEARGKDVEASISDDGVAAAAFFDHLANWWADEGTRRQVLDQHEKACWPSWLREGGLGVGLRGESPDHWLALFLLGACQGLGRTQDLQHRDFLSELKDRGWWDVFLQPGDDRAWMEVLREWQDGAVDRLRYGRWLSLFPTIYQLSRHLDAYRRLLNSAAERPKHLYSLRRLLAPRADDALSGAGSPFDVPPLPLGIGFHWCLRELARLKVLGADHLFADCYVPGRRVLELLRPLGLVVEDNDSTDAKSQAICQFLQEDGRLDSVQAHLLLAFDIPLRHIAKNGSLRREWGLGYGSQKTRRGEWVLSKSEKIIADVLFEQHVDYEYEKELSAPDGTRRVPDFTIRCSGDEWYWEHWGMMDDPSYFEDRRSKLEWYRKHFNGRLEETFESGDVVTDAIRIIRKRDGARR